MSDILTQIAKKKIIVLNLKRFHELITKKEYDRKWFKIIQDKSSWNRRK